MIRRTPLTPYWHARKAGFHGGYRHYGVTTIPLPTRVETPVYVKELPAPKREPRHKREKRITLPVDLPITITEHASIWDHLEHDRVWISHLREWR